MLKYPRKLKKKLFGKRMSKSKIRKRISEVKSLGKDGYGGVILSDYFCPNCGCEGSECYDHGVAYPEVWRDYSCSRCGEQVATEDNSPLCHVLENYLEELC